MIARGRAAVHAALHAAGPTPTFDPGPRPSLKTHPGPGLNPGPKVNPNLGPGPASARRRGADRRRAERHVRGHRATARHRRSRERGSAALEVAIAMPVVVVLLVTGVVTFTALFAKLNCLNAAGVAARAMARGEPVPDLGEGTEVAVEHDGDLVRVTVRMRVPAPMMSGFTVEERAVAMAEPRAAAGP
ncbi:TadE family type IV pilus minor pilin [Dactylosporangium sp. NPDC051484]|uniref:TadE family type IV pilus minor pilin n=1 Tax=Dactylosporangium sp. NPDC051484 TaxID=3154942 RepID=UPI00344E9296